jgi:hypothetical protein
MQKRREQIGEDHIREVEAEWPTLIAAVRAEMAKGTDPSDPAVQQMARRWKELVKEFTGGDPAIARGVTRVYKEGPGVAQRMNLDAAVFEYVGRAVALQGGWQ